MNDPDLPENKPLCPTITETARVLTASSRYWNEEVAIALQSLSFGIRQETSSLLWVRERVPPLPQCTGQEKLASAPLSSRWVVNGPENCTTTASVIEVPGPRIQLYTSSPISANLDGNSFSRWNDSAGERQSNMVSVMALAWCYIISARLLELQGLPASRILYTQSRAPVQMTPNKSSGFLLYSRCTNTRRLRWFSAILATDVGYRPSVNGDDASSLCAAWATKLTFKGCLFTIVPCTESGYDDDSSAEPLSSHEALEALEELCLQYDIEPLQIEVGLGVAVLLPLHNALGLPLRLPQPHAAQLNNSLSSTCLDLFESLYTSLPHLITLSGSYEVLNSALCGIFWNPAVSSNFVSPWLQPLEDILDGEDIRGIPGREWEVLAAIGTRRTPQLGIFCISAAISGLLPTIVVQVRSGQPPLEPHSLPWTGVPQSFMDLAGHGAYCVIKPSGKYLRRADCWRLRKIPSDFDDGLHYDVGPFSPWEPPGECLTQNCPIRVRRHLHCSRHSRTYQSSIWLFNSGHTIEERPQICWPVRHFLEVSLDSKDEIASEERILRDEYASVDATVSVFRWVMDNDEGKPPEAAYQDSWLSNIHYGSDTASEDGYTSTSDICISP